MTFCLVKFLRKQHAFSLKAFGPVERGIGGIMDHLRKELIEIEKDPDDTSEWADGLLLLLDGAMRAGHSPNQIVHALEEKLAINMTRKWPDWRNVPVGRAIEHIRH